MLIKHSDLPSLESIGIFRSDPGVLTLTLKHVFAACSTRPFRFTACIKGARNITPGRLFSHSSFLQTLELNPPILSLERLATELVRTRKDMRDIDPLNPAGSVAAWDVRIAKNPQHDDLLLIVFPAWIPA